MAKRIPEHELNVLEAVVSAHPAGIAIRDIHSELDEETARRTLQYRLTYLVGEGRLVRKGIKRWARYFPPASGGQPVEAAEKTEESASGVVPLSSDAVTIREQVRRPLYNRTPVGYRRAFLDAYRPNDTAYLSETERARLWAAGDPTPGKLPAGTWARRVLNRLLVDLSWNSSRLEGNTYSPLDTRRLIWFGEAAKGKERFEAQMILNHKDAIEFLVDSADEIAFDRHTIRNLHALLANNLLADPSAPGRLRRIPVAIGGSVFHPLEVPQLVEECLDQILATASAVEDPFEQALFVMVQLPYLQPFEDVNKRVSRLAANVPLIRRNLTPLTFVGVNASDYTEATLGVYELNRVDLLKHVFIHAYERSASRYAAVRQSIGEPDPFRMKHREALRSVLRTVVVERMNNREAFAHIAHWAGGHIEDDELEQFREVAESELMGLHEGNFARYRVRRSQFEAWREVRTGPEP